MTDGFDHIDDLIGKYLSGEATTAERLQVEQWTAQSEANTKYFLHLQEIFQKSARARHLQKFDVDAAWRKVHSKMERPRGRSVTMTPYWSALRVAALLLLTVGAGYFVYQWLSQPIETLAIDSKNEIVRDTLPDGSLAVLNKNSTIQYAYHPGNKKRTVVLEGEAFFEVKHEEEKPFVIEAGDVIIEDIGTTFNVTAFPERETVEVYVETGEVAFYTLKDAGLNLGAGETGIYNKKTQSFARLLKMDTNRLAYKTGIFAFHNADLQTIVDDLNSVYSTKVRLANDQIKSCRLNVSFRNEKIEDIVAIIAETLSLTVTKEGDEYVLDGISCTD